jgi:hypothetical protein
MTGYYFPPPPPPPPQPNALLSAAAPDQRHHLQPSRGGRAQHRGGRGRGRGAPNHNTPSHVQRPHNGGQQYGVANQSSWNNSQRYPNQPHAPQAYNPPTQWLPSHIPPPTLPVQYPQVSHMPGPYTPRGGYPHQAPVLRPEQPAVPHHPSQVPFNANYPQAVAPPIRMGFNENRGRFPPSNQHRSHNSPNPTLGQKRRREQSPSGLNRADRSQVKTVPATPNFGFSLALPPKPPPVAPSRKKKRRKTNQLGLTPKGETRDDTDEDLDEEATFASNGGP